LICAIVILLLVRLILLSRPEIFMTVPNGDLDTFVFAQREITYRTGEAPSPRVLLLGSSRTLYITSPMLSQRLGLPESEASNYGFPGLITPTHLLLLKRNPAMLERCKLLILECTPGTYYRVRTNELLSRTLFCRFADLSDRIAQPTVGLKVQTLGDFIFPFISYRNNPAGWRVFAHQLAMNQEERAQDFLTPGTLTHRAAHPPQLGHRSADEIIRDVAPLPIPYVPAERALAEIIRIAPADCKIVIWIPPLRSDFMGAIAQNPEMKESFDAFRRVFESFDDDRVQIEWFDSPDAMSVTDDDFVDPVHFSLDVVRGKLLEDAARVVAKHLPDLAAGD